MSMGNERGENGGLQKAFYIKTIINDLRANYTNYLGTDINSVYRLHTLWYHFLGSKIIESINQIHGVVLIITFW
jgi:hypothetical protein